MIFLKKSILFLIIFILIVSAGCDTAEARRIDKGAFDALYETVKTVGFDEITVEETDRENSYKIFLKSEEFDDYVDTAKNVCESYGSEGFEMLLILAKEGKPNELFDIISKRYEWTPCDPAEKIIFAEYGGVVIAVKGKKESAEKVYDSFCAFFDIQSCKKREKERISEYIG